MSSVVHVALNTSPEQTARLEALQAAFADVCNALAPVVQETRCWNRVGLHHLAYRQLRERFPRVGSQMVCNAIYSVSRTCRVVFQHPGSPFHLSRLEGKPLPLLRFADTCPVYFDRHTLTCLHVKVFAFHALYRACLDIQQVPFPAHLSLQLRSVIPYVVLSDILRFDAEAYTCSFVAVYQSPTFIGNMQRVAGRVDKRMQLL